MDKIKELTDFYMWMQENDYDHNIRARVERKAGMYLNRLNVVQKLPIKNVSNLLCGSFDADLSTSSPTKCKCGREKWQHPKSQIIVSKSFLKWSK